MFGRFFGFMKPSNKQESTQEKEVIPGTTLTYDKTLVIQLHNDHKALLVLYSKIGKYLEKEDYPNIQSHLAQFATLLRTHLLLENLKLYVYLTKALAHDAENLELMIGMRKEMGHIGRTVNQFLTRYTETLPWTPEKTQSFAGEFKHIGKILVERISREEQRLYTLYMPPSSYSTIILD